MDQPVRRRPARRAAFTLIELMVVAAIIVALLTVTMPAVRSLMSSNQLAESENALRASLLAARTYAMHKSVVAGIRCQDDGRIVQVYAANYTEVCNNMDYGKDLYGLDGSGVFRNVLRMKAVEGLEPNQLSGPFRATVCDVGSCSRAQDDGGGYMSATWAGDWSADSGEGHGIRKQAAPQWLDQNAWLVFPVVLFSRDGRTVLLPCKFSGDPADAWYPTLTGSFGKVTTAQRNPNALNCLDGPNYVEYLPPPRTDTELIHTNQVPWVGWRAQGIYGQNCNWASQTIVVETPTVTSALRLFNYDKFRQVYPGKTYDHAAAVSALTVIIGTGSDCIINPNTGLMTRTRTTWVSDN